MRRGLKSTILTLSALLWSGALLACPLCAENMSNDVYGKQPSQLGRGFFWSIIFMMALPFVTVGTMAVKIYLAKRRASGPQLDASS